MAPPVIALRYRDSTPGVETIGEHKAILLAHGRVWWGWWRKITEEAAPADVPTSANDLYLVDRSTERMFRARSDRFTTDTSEIDPNLVPEYYREHISEIAGFFLIREIEPADYDPGIAAVFGERTLVYLDTDIAAPTSDHIAAPAAAAGRRCLLHLSDLHFGDDYGYLPAGTVPEIGDQRRRLTECLIADLDRVGLREEIGAVIVTGDFITRGDWNDTVRDIALRELNELREALHLEKDQLIAVPGNHDIVRYPEGANVNAREFAVRGQTSLKHEREFRTFVDELANRSWRESLNYVRRIRLGECDLLVCVVNSCTITATEWTEYGYIGPAGLDAIRALADESIERPTFKFLALHHHLLPVADVEEPSSRGVTLALDASKILASAQDVGVHFILHGHQHKPKLAIYQCLPLNHGALGYPIHVISNGSASVLRDRLPIGERNTYCLFEVQQDGTVRLRLRELRADAEPGAEAFNSTLSAPATQP